MNLSNDTLMIFIASKIAGASASTYADICGSYVEGLLQWYTHHVEDVQDSENTKYYGWKVFCEGQEQPTRIVLPRYIGDIIETKASSFKHARNLWAKYARVV